MAFHRFSQLRITAAIIVFVLLATPTAASAEVRRFEPAETGAVGTNPSAVPGVSIVKARSDDTAGSLAATLGMSSSHIKMWRHGVAEVRTPKGKSDVQFRRELQANPNVEYAEPVYFRTLSAIELSPNDPDYTDLTAWTDGEGWYNAAKAWWLRSAGVYAFTLWSRSGSSPWGARAAASEFPIAVIDSGAYLSHPELGPNIVSKRDEFSTYDEATGVLTGDADVTPVDPSLAPNGVRETSHGTFVSGMIGAATDNGIGLASVTQDMPVWVYKVQGVYYNADFPQGVAAIIDTAVINAIYDATDDGARVINLSLGGPEYSDALQGAIDYAYANGVLVVAATGNEGDLNGVWYPAANNHVVGVGAFGLNGSGTKTPAAFSNRGIGADPLDAGENNGGVDILAPGRMIWGLVEPTWDEDGAGTAAVPGYTFMQGTSMASPAFAAAAAFLWRFGPDLSPDEVAALYTQTAVSTGDPADGAGYMNTDAAYTRLTVVVPDRVPPPRPAVSALAVSSSSIKLSWNSVYDVSGISRYSVYLADGTWLADTGSIQYTVTGLASATTYAFYVTATDGDGNVSAPSPVASATTYPEVDTTPPPAPSGLRVVSTDRTNISLEWNAVSDPSNIARYTVYLADGTLKGVTSSTNRLITGLLPATDYSFYVTATDNAGNESEPSQIVTGRTKNPVDTTAPPPPTGVVATAVSPTSIVVTWDEVIDPSGITSYQAFTLEGALLGWTHSTARTFTVTGLRPSTSYGYTVKATDNALNRSQASAPAFAVTLADTTPPPAPSVFGHSVNPTSVNLSWFAVTDESVITKYSVYCDSRLLGEVTGCGYVASGLAPSTWYRFTVTATDAAGLTSMHSDTFEVVTQTPVYRFYRPSTGTHFYTASQAEMEQVRDTMQSTYQLEGVGYSLDGGNAQNDDPLYRLYNRRTGTHLYTVSESEKDSILANLSHTYSLDGVAYMVTSVPTAGDVAVHRFYSPAKGTHFYSANATEIAYVREHLSRIWQYEGFAYAAGQ